MTTTRLALASLALASLISLAPVVHADQQTSFEWADNYKVSSSDGYLGTYLYKSTQWFSTVADCKADQNARLNDPTSGKTYTAADPTASDPTLCTCDKAIYVQPNCPDYNSANAAVAHSIPLYGACAWDNDNQCVSGTVCGIANGNSVCIPGNLTSGATCTLDKQCQSGSCSQSQCTAGGGAPNPGNPGGGGGGVVSPTPSGTNGVLNGSSGSQASGQLMNPLGANTTLSSLLATILQFVTQIGAIVVIVMLVYIGFLFVTARGEPDKINEAKEALQWTVIGALILLGAQAISLGIQATVTAISG